MGMYHPWRAFRHLAADYVLHWAPLPGGRLGETNFDANTVTLTPGMSYEQRRSTIAHELEHILKGYDDCTTRDECQVERRAALKLITIEALGEALAWSNYVEEICEELGVDVDMLHARLAHLHPKEIGQIRRRLDNPSWRPPVGGT